MSVIDFTHWNVMDIDPAFETVGQGVKAFRLAKLEYKTIVPKSGKNQGVEVPIVSGRFIVINDDTFSGRRLNHTFWLDNTYDQKGLRRLVDAIGVPQTPGESIEDFCKRVSSLEPAPEFKTFLAEVEKGVDEVTGKPIKDNQMKWNQVSPV